MNNVIYTIIPEGKYKGKRLYDENKYGHNDILPIEMYYLFLNAFKNNYKVFFLNCTSIHNIKIPEYDLEFLKTSIDFYKGKNIDLYNNHTFSEEVLKLKNFQYKDILKIYNMAIKTDQIGALFIHPQKNLDFYCFDIILIVKNEFNLNNLLNINFNLFKINSINEFTKNNLTIEVTHKIYDIKNWVYKDYYIPSDEIKKTRPYNSSDLPEQKELNKYLDLSIDFMQKNPKSDNLFFKEKIYILKNKLFKKLDDLLDRELYKKLIFSKMCMQFYFFHEIIESDTLFFTNFIQIVGGVSVKSNEDSEVYLDYEELQPYSLIDMFYNDDHQLFSIFYYIFKWYKK